jgi:hypothetical protein
VSGASAHPTILHNSIDRFGNRIEFRKHIFDLLGLRFNGLQDTGITLGTMTESLEVLRGSIPTCTRQDIMRYRYHHACNLGGVFVVEKWLFPSCFPSDAGNRQTSELECVTANVNQVGVDKTRINFENRWKNSISDADFDWLVKKAHCELQI